MWLLTPGEGGNEVVDCRAVSYEVLTTWMETGRRVSHKVLVELADTV